MGQGDLGHAVIWLLNAVARDQGITHLQPTNKWEREVLQDSVAEGDFRLGCTRSARRVNSSAALQKGQKVPQMPLSSCCLKAATFFRAGIETWCPSQGLVTST